MPGFVLEAMIVVVWVQLVDFVVDWIEDLMWFLWNRLIDIYIRSLSAGEKSVLHNDAARCIMH